MTYETAFSVFGKIVAGVVACYVVVYVAVAILSATLGDVPNFPDNSGRYRFFWECRGERRDGSPWLPPRVARADDEVRCGEHP